MSRSLSSDRGSICTLFFAVVGLAIPSSGCIGMLEDLPASAGGGRVERPGTTDRTDAGPGPIIDDSDRFECVPGSDPSAGPLRRLSVTEYRNTLEALFERSLGPDGAHALIGSMGAAIDRLPTDSHPDSTRLSQLVSQAHVDGYHEIALAIGRAIAGDARQLGALVGSCATNGEAADDRGCLDTFVREFGELALRRPLATQEISFYRDVAYVDGDTVVAEGIAELVAIFLSSPSFLYHTELEGSPVAGAEGVYALSAYELASRLSYHFWQTMPDATLLALAADDSLLGEAVYAEEVERVFHDPRTRASIDRFFSEWLRLEQLPPLAGSDTSLRFRAFAPGVVPTTELREDMIGEVIELTRDAVWRAGGSLDDLFLSDVSFARTEALADLYGVAPWTGDPSSPVRFAPGERVGVLTRAALLTNGTASSHPILRGAFVRRRILCDVLPDPPMDFSALLETDTTDSERTRIETLTETPGSSCLGCHSQINPLGLALEGFDALGRARTEEIVLGDDGSELARHPIDDDTVPRVRSDDTRTSTGAGDLVRFILDSGKAEMCFTRHYFRYAFGRVEDVRADGCTLESLRARLEGGGSLEGMLREVALTPAFRLRVRGEL